jgi:RNA-splicing ligase RtcB
MDYLSPPPWPSIEDACRIFIPMVHTGILVLSETRDGILEELPEAYKNVDEVIEVVHNAGLARKVVCLRP